MECQDIVIRLWDDYDTTLGRAAAAIGKINRFQGRLRVPHWTVLHHSYLGYELAAREYEQRSQSAFVRDVYLHFLIHDLIEALWGDTNGHVKTKDQRIGERLSAKLMCGSLGIDFPAGAVNKKIHEIDKRCMFAEAMAFGDQKDSHVQLLSSMADGPAVDMALSVRETYWRPEHSNQPDGELVKDYLGHVGALLASAKAVAAA